MKEYYVKQLEISKKNFELAKTGYLQEVHNQAKVLEGADYKTINEILERINFAREGMKSLEMYIQMNEKSLKEESEKELKVGG